MINEEKVRIMTRCAAYEKSRGKIELPMAGYFKSDYVKFNVWKTLLAVIVAFIIVTGIFLIAYYEEVFAELNQMHFKKLGFMVGSLLFAVLLIYYFIARLIYAYRFEKARKGVTVYYRDLKRLKALYDKDKDNRPKLFDEGGTVVQNDEFIDY